MRQRLLQDGPLGAYPTDDLLIDLECLMNRQSPKMARTKIKAGTLEGLAEGDEEDDSPSPGASPNQVVWLAVLGSLLTLSVLVNLILLLRRG